MIQKAVNIILLSPATFVETVITVRPRVSAQIDICAIHSVGTIDWESIERPANLWRVRVDIVIIAHLVDQAAREHVVMIRPEIRSVATTLIEILVFIIHGVTSGVTDTAASSHHGEERNAVKEYAKYRILN